jgi:hypothetical protein
MALTFFGTNGLTIIIAAVVSFFIGMLWYGPLFGKTWISLQGFSKKDINQSKKKGMGKTILVAFLSNLIVAFVFAKILLMIGVTDLFGGIVIGFWLWLGFVATTTLGSVLWENKSFNLWFLNNSFNVINLIVIGAILGNWQ